MRLHWQQKSFHRVSRLVAFSGPVVRGTMRVSIGAVYFGALYVMEAQGSLTPRRHGRSVRGTTTSVPHAPRAPLILTLTLTLSLSLALALSLSLTSWFGFFSTFFTMFTAAPLMSEIRKPSSLNLSNGDIVQADICAVLPAPS